MSRADALRLLLALGPDQVAGPAWSLGFRWRPDSELDGESGPRAKASAPSATATPDADAEDRGLGGEDLAPLPVWRPVAAQRQDEERQTPQVLLGPAAEKDLERDELAAPSMPPPARPIVAEARLRRRLDTLLRATLASRAIDVDALVRRIARGEGLDIVYRRQAALPARVMLILDGAERLMPLRADVLDFAVALFRHLGRHAIDLMPAPDRRFGARRLARLVRANDLVLAVSDLGFYAHEEDSDRWLALGRRLHEKGARLSAWVPCPAWRWRPEAARLWQAVDWSRPEGAGKTQPLSTLTGTPVTDPVEALLRLAAPAVRMEPGLLRALRQLLGPAADLGTEVDVWNHPLVDGSSPNTLSIEPTHHKALMGEGLVAGWDPALVAAAARTIIGWHRGRQGRAELVWASDVAQLRACGVSDQALGSDTVASAALAFARAAHSARSADPARAGITGGLLAFWHRSALRAPASLADDTRFGDAFARGVQAARRADPLMPLPAGMAPAMFADPDPDLPVRRFTVRQHGEHLVISPVAAGKISGKTQGKTPGKIQGSPVIEIAGRRVLTLGRGVQASQEISLDPEKTVKVPVEVSCPTPEPVSTLRMVTEVDTVDLEAWQPPAWVSASGRDGYGLWVAFAIHGIEQRLRWMPPGRFRMGSPKTEAGRWGNEGPCHDVVLAEGFWLAEMPCTQALWQAVMGENPSRFVSPDRPVERVSWDDCQRFIDRLNFRLPGLELDLPSEAEWEYACRAGTTTATWRGDLEILGARNAPILDEIAWYGGNSGVAYDLETAEDTSKWPEKQHAHQQAGTREVAGKQANPWGLHDMLGNVWEWCRDRRGTYHDALEVDPEGPEDGPMRVFRGGSWLVHARYVRAAFRSGGGPGYRGDLGFRLSRGPRAGGAQARSVSAVSEAERRGTSRRARSRGSRTRRSRAWVERLGWAVDGGLDPYGRWAAFEVAGVRHRLRWIYPGHFQMGSPEAEAGRDQDEGPRHGVTLTQGFWLGEVPCTQALWQAVMDENPSQFRSPDRPVENVGWQDCQTFYQRLGEIAPRFHGRLPTEAQWEYACRAGTTEATWAGDLEILGERNAPRLDNIAWYGGNSGVDFELANGYDVSDWQERQYTHDRAGTHPVGLKRANPWGLHDMLGNVWEWCEDSWNYDGYPGGDRVDPLCKDGPGRVLRGGSWDVLARGVRAAYRLGDEPGDRLDYLGFRLSRGPQEQEGAEPPAQAPGPRSGGRQARDEPPARPRMRGRRSKRKIT